ncbi:MAG: BON domain-containing protein [Burkholderiales bacterium]
MQPGQVVQHEPAKADKAKISATAKRADPVSGPADAALEGKVKSALSATLGEPGEKIRVTAVGGVVSLHGAVGSVAARKGAQLAAARVLGVKAINNNLAVVRRS